MKEINTEKLYEYLKKTNQTHLDFVEKLKANDWELSKQLTNEYAEKYNKDRNFILAKDEMEKFAQFQYIAYVIYFNFLFPFTYTEFLKWFKAVHSTAGNFDVYLKLTPVV